MSKSRVVELRFQLVLPEPKNQNDPIQVWLPIPISTPQQDVISIQSGGTLPVSMGFDPIFGNAILHAATDGTDRGPVRIEYRALIERKEWKVNLAATQPLVLTRDVGLLAPQLSETRKIRFLPDIAKAASEIRTAKNGALEIARAAYDHVLATMTYDKSGDGWGAGDTEYACSMGKGNCTDFHTLFIAILRCCGVACEFEIGAAFPAGQQGGDITDYKCGYHCWVRFFVPELGWVPADVSEASRHPDKCNYFFGAIDEDRVMVSRGRDITMVPQSLGGPENFFSEPRIEKRSGNSVIYEKKLEFSSF